MQPVVHYAYAITNKNRTLREASAPPGLRTLKQKPDERYFGSYLEKARGSKWIPLWAKIREELEYEFKLVYNAYGPQIIRLAWHQAATFCPHSGTGGCQFASMRFSAESCDPENTGLDRARAYLKGLRKRYPTTIGQISYADLWVLAAYVALEMTGGPAIVFEPGRVDSVSHVYKPLVTGSRLPAADKGVNAGKSDLLEKEAPTIQEVERVFYRLGFNDQEIVALMCGGHVLGRCHREWSGFQGPWAEDEMQWSNEYAADLLADEWREIYQSSPEVPEDVCPAAGHRQFINESGKQMMLVADMVIKWVPKWRAVAEKYAEDQQLLAKDFAAAFKKLTELNFEYSQVNARRTSGKSRSSSVGQPRPSENSPSKASN